MDAPDSRPRIWTCFVYPLIAIVLALFLQAMMGVVLALSMVASGESSGDLEAKILERVADPDLFILTIALGQLAFAALVVVPAFFAKDSWGERFGLRSVERPLEVYGYTLTGSIFVLAIAIGAAYLGSLPMAADDAPPFYEAFTPGWGILFVAVIALLPGTTEEILFRGYVQQRLMTRWNPTFAIFVTSVLFGIAHLTPPAIALAFILGAWFGFIAWRTHSILPCMACHAFVNGGVNTFRLGVLYSGVSDQVATTLSIVLVLIGLVGFVSAVRLLMKMQPHIDHPPSGASEHQDVRGGNEAGSVSIRNERA